TDGDRPAGFGTRRRHNRGRGMNCLGTAVVLARNHFRGAKIKHLNVKSTTAVGFHPDVVWLQIAMNNSSRMCPIKCERDLIDHIHDLVQGHWSVLRMV